MQHSTDSGQLIPAEEAAPKRGSSRGKRKRTLAQAQAKEEPEKGGLEREKRYFRGEFEVPLQDVTNGFWTRKSLPPPDTNVFGICLPGTYNEIKSLMTSPTDEDCQRTPPNF